MIIKIHICKYNMVTLIYDVLYLICRVLPINSEINRFKITNNLLFLAHLKCLLSCPKNYAIIISFHIESISNRTSSCLHSQVGATL